MDRWQINKIMVIRVKVFVLTNWPDNNDVIRLNIKKQEMIPLVEGLDTILPYIQ